MERIKKLIGPIMVTIIIFLIIEVMLRAFVINSSQLGNYGYNPQGLGDLLPNKNFIDSGLKCLPYLVITNSQGLRNEEEIDFSDDNYRILTIGDSFTYGPYVNNQDTWQAVLEEKLRTKYPGQKTQVLNAGVAGYTITDELEYLQEKGVKTKPNLVILGIYANDINDLKPEKRAIFARSVQKIRTKNFSYHLINLAKKTAFFNFLEKNKAKILAEKVKKQLSEIEDSSNNDNFNKEYLKKLREFIDYCQDNGLTLLIVIFPQSDFKNNINFTDKNLDILNMTLFFQNKDINDLYLIPYNNHLSSYGYQQTAQIIFDYLVLKNLLNNQ